MTTKAVSDDMAIDQLIRTVEAQMARWMHHLACGHKVLADDPEVGEMFCPGCHADSEIKGLMPYQDEECA